jgi:ComF family protein
MLSALGSLGRILLDVVFPRICCGCDERIVEQGRIVCSRCERAMRPLRSPVCPRCGAEDAPLSAAGRCPLCPRGEIFFEAARAATLYAGPARAVVERLKYRARTEYADAIVPLMLRTFAEHYAQIPFDGVVPVPLHRTRRRERGYNQSELLARGLAQELALPVLSASLVRTRPTPSQTRLGRQAREKNVRGAFEVRIPDSVAGKALLLVDDVCTTGATLNECARVLRAHGARIVCALSFCRAPLH